MLTRQERIAEATKPLSSLKAKGIFEELAAKYPDRWLCLQEKRAVIV